MPRPCLIGRGEGLTAMQPATRFVPPEMYGALNNEAQHPRNHLSLRLEKIDGKAQGGRRPGGFVCI